LRPTPLLAALALTLSLGACDVILGIPDRKVGPRLQCEDGKCACEDGYGNCDGDAENGCETRLATSGENCGACGNDCHGGACNDGLCACSELFVDCDGDPRNGCEAELATDPVHCGACGHPCLGGGCVDGRCQPVALRSFNGPQSISVAGGLLYVAVCSEPLADPILQMPTFGDVPIAHAIGLDCGISQAVSGESLYWTNAYTIFVNALESPEPPTPILMTDTAVKGLAIGPSHVYWRAEDDDTLDGGVFRAPHGSNVGETISTVPALGLVVDDQKAYWSDANGLHAIAHNGASVTNIPGASVPAALAIDGSTLYVVENSVDTTGILAIPLPSGPPTMIAPGAGAFAMAVDQGNLYWLDYYDGNAWELSLSTGERRVLAEGPGYAYNADLAFDDTAIYWLAEDSVYKVVR
jgi:hypothetical protein